MLPMATPPDSAYVGYPGQKRPRAAWHAADAALVAYMASGMSASEAGAKAGMSPRTARRKAASPEFQERLAEARAQVVDTATAQLAAAATDAVSTLRRLLMAESEMARLGAARAILDSLMRFREHTVLTGRLDALEGRYGE